MKLLPVTVTPACANSAKSDACWQCPHSGSSPRILVRFSCTTANVCRLCFWRAHTHLQSRSTPRPRFVLRQRPLYLFVPSSLLFPWFGFCSCCCKWVRVNACMPYLFGHRRGRAGGNRLAWQRMTTRASGTEIQREGLLPASLGRGL